jgi:uncharacterized protein (TIGR01777 family)
MKLLIAGGTGFIGTSLCHTLAQHGHALLVLTRRPATQSPPQGGRFVSWEHDEWRRAMPHVDGVINLAGESIAARRWSPSQKVRIRESRLETTRRLVSAISASSKKPAVLINASAIGYYGPRGDEALTERDPAGEGFLAELCQAWEAEAQRAEPLGVRVVRLRIGLVFGAGGGALAKMGPPFRFFLGGPLGTGRQWVSWVHQQDVAALIEWVLAHPELSGAVNATAPSPVTMRELCTTLGRVMHRPSWAPVPAFALKLLVGEMADLLLTGQRILPAAARSSGFTFRFPELAPALEACLRPRHADE